MGVCAKGIRVYVSGGCFVIVVFMLLTDTCFLIEVFLTCIQVSFSI